MRILLFIAALGVLALVASCETLNVGSGTFSRGPQPTVTVPTGTNGGGQGTFNVSIVGGRGPFTLTYTFSGCTTPLTHTRTTNTTTDSLTVTFLSSDETENCTVTVDVRDADGLTGTTGARPFTVGPSLNEAPTITATANGTNIDVTVSDPDGDTMSVVATAPAGFGINPPSQTVVADGTVTFSTTAADIFAGGTGTFSFTVDDGNGGTATATASVTHAGVVLLDDTIYAIPLQSSVAVGAPVRIVLATGDPAQPFQYQNSVGLFFPSASGATYVDDSFDTGIPDGDDDADSPIDGIWAIMNPADGFLLGPDSFNRGNTYVDDNLGSITRFDITVTPNGGSDINGAGALASIEVTFSTPGTYTPNFVRTSAPDGIDRTYYQDGSQTMNHYWSDDNNADSNAPHTITVT